MMTTIKVKRENDWVKTKIAEMQIGDIFKDCDGNRHTCTAEPIYDEDENCYYIRSKGSLFNEYLLTDIG